MTDCQYCSRRGSYDKCGLESNCKETKGLNTLYYNYRLFRGLDIRSPQEPPIQEGVPVYFYSCPVSRLCFRTTKGRDVSWSSVQKIVKHVTSIPKTNPTDKDMGESQRSQRKKEREDRCLGN